MHEYDCAVAVEFRDEDAVVRIVSTDDDEEGAKYVLKPEGLFGGFVMYSLLEEGSPESQRIFFSGSGRTLFALIYV